MCPGCHAVRPTCSAHRGTHSSSVASKKNATSPAVSGSARRATHPICSTPIPMAYRSAHARPSGCCTAAQPQRDHRQPHHHIADRDDPEARVDERSWHPCREDEHAGHEHEHRDAIRHVVRVVGRREPREVHPRPPDREEDERERKERVSRVATDEAVVEALARLRDRDDERQVEEELERRRRSMLLLDVARRHPHVQRHRGSLAAR